jgi:predicted oxidoreductase
MTKTNLMQQKQKQQLVTNQVNIIRNAIKQLQRMEKDGLYLDKRQRKALFFIGAEELAPLYLK